MFWSAHKLTFMMTKIVVIITGTAQSIQSHRQPLGPMDRVSQAAPMVYIDPRPQKYLCEMYSVVIVAGFTMD